MEQDFYRRQKILNEKKDKFNEIKVAAARLDVREEDLRAIIQQELKQKPQELSFSERKIDENQLDAKVLKLKNEKERLGEIDPLILEEYQETLKRFNFLNQEKADIEKAIISLKEIIEKMDQKIEVVFQSAFQAVNQEFSKYFKIIFGGGRAKLVKVWKTAKKTDEDDNDESIGKKSKNIFSEKEKQELGIEIEVAPPGKKIKHLSMLSGGERSLTSIALLFAIISHNPPPFIVLDEVEAALDESNSRRFSKILKELSQRTQFIAITHNRETMHQADFLYGVTMGNDGVSKMLSVKLED